jgi:hypothetical protein
VERSRTFDIGVICIAFGGIYLLYQSALYGISAVLQLSYAGQDPLYASDVFLTLSPTIATIAVGAVLVRGRYQIARSLFGYLETRDEPLSPVSLEGIVTLVGLWFFISGFLCTAEIVTEWVAGNVRPGLERHPMDVWPYRVSAVLELGAGYVLLFHARAVAHAINVRQRSPGRADQSGTNGDGDTPP